MALVASVMRAPEMPLDHEQAFLDLVVAAVKGAGCGCPSSGFSLAQRRRHAALTQQLGRLPGWTSIALEPDVRRDLAHTWLERLGLTAEDLCAAPTSPRRGPL